MTKFIGISTFLELCVAFGIGALYQSILAPPLKGPSNGFTLRVTRFYLFQYRTSYNFNILHHQYPFDNNSIMVLRFQDWKLDLRMDVEAIRQLWLFGLDL